MRWISCALVSGFFLISLSLQSAEKKLPKDYVPGEWIIETRQVVSDAELKDQFLAASFFHAEEIEFESFQTDPFLKLVKVDPQLDLNHWLGTLDDQSLVRTVERNSLLTTYAQPLSKDPDFGKQWGHHNGGQINSTGETGVKGADSGLLPVWKKGILGSKKIIVAVIDTGIEWSHPDLKENIYTNPGEAGALANNGVDDDNNGFVDDTHGWNFASNDWDSRDDHYHGTHCAGIIGAVKDNGIGIAGVSPLVSLLPIKFLDAKGRGTAKGSIESINYARLMGAHVINASWGGRTENQLLKSAIEKAHAANIIFVAAAGNNKSDNELIPSFPANYDIDNIISVAATNNRDRLASFSNWSRNLVDVAAPGDQIYSTVIDGKYKFASGTSMAAPYVSGAIALMKSYHPNWSMDEIIQRVIRSSDSVNPLRRKSVSGGRLNIYNAIFGIFPDKELPVESEWKTADFVVETPHPYAVNQKYEYRIHYPGAKFVRAIFDVIDIEEKWDKIYFSEPRSTDFGLVSGLHRNWVSDYAFGDTLLIRLESDVIKTGWGFKISKIQYILK